MKHPHSRRFLAVAVTAALTASPVVATAPALAATANSATANPTASATAPFTTTKDATATDAPQPGTASASASATPSPANTATRTPSAGRSTGDGIAPHDGAAAQDEATAAQDLVLQTGATDSERRVSWQTKEKAPGDLYVRWGDADAAGDPIPAEDKFPHSARATADTAVDGRTSYRATLSGLDRDTDEDYIGNYIYQVGSDATGWSEMTFFDSTTKGQDEFNVFGDPQIGSSGDVKSDTAGWKRTLGASFATNKRANFFYTLGDQVEHAADQGEYSGYLSPATAREIPQATTLGNHEAGSTAYGDHFNRPNVSDAYGTNVEGTGGDYWFISDDVLFVNFNANASTDDDIAGHKEFLDKVVAAQGKNAKWTAVVFHKAPFSTANHLDDADVMAFRKAFPAAFADNDVDIVLGGHDHIYSRTHLLGEDGTPSNADEDVEKGQSVADKKADASAPVNLVKDDGETLYYTLTSSSGSKFYDMYTDEQMDEAGFPRDNIDVTEQTETPGYLNVKVADCKLTLTTRQVGSDGDDSVVETVNLAKDAASTKADCADDEPSGSTDPSQSADPTETAQPGGDADPADPTDEAAPGPGDNGTLPRTGVAAGLTALGGLLLLAAGGITAFLARRRPRD